MNIFFSLSYYHHEWCCSSLVLRRLSPVRFESWSKIEPNGFKAGKGDLVIYDMCTCHLYISTRTFLFHLLAALGFRHCRRRGQQLELGFFSGRAAAAKMVEKGNKGRKEEVVTREYTINLHKRLHGWCFSLFCFTLFSWIFASSFYVVLWLLNHFVLPLEVPSIKGFSQDRSITVVASSSGSNPLRSVTVAFSVLYYLCRQFLRAFVI